MARLQDSHKDRAANIEIKEISEDQILENGLAHTRQGEFNKEVKLLNLSFRNNFWCLCRRYIGEKGSLGEESVVVGALQSLKDLN